MYDLAEGAYLVRLARRTVGDYLDGSRKLTVQDPPPPKLREKAGVFVTLETFPERALRGCIGFPEPQFPLLEGTMRAAIAAATQDPRFPPLTRRELDRTLLEVTVLTPPTPIEARDPSEYLDAIEIGRDGLIIENGARRGLLLPQVPVDQKWGKEEFLAHTCLKAGLSSESWKDLTATKVCKFSGKVFSEEEPGGAVKAQILKVCR
jgi:hypothetical protein